MLAAIMCILPPQAASAARRFIPTLELLEQRELLATGVFLQGTAFVDASHDHTLDSNDPYLQGALISLYQGTTTSGTPLAVAVTDSNGAYLFNDTNVVTSYANLGLNPGSTLWWKRRL